MIIYILLLCFVIVSPNIYRGFRYNSEQRRNMVLSAIFMVVFLICALKSSEVGRDISAYKSAYEMTQKVAFNDFSYIYFENGYIFLMKVCIFLNMPFQLFMVLVYAVIIIPIYLFIKKYSDDTWMSALIYICYMYFEFNMTGIRQAIASSICLLAFVVLLENSKYKYVKYTMIVTLATLFHSASFIAYFVIFAQLIFSIRNYLLFLLAGTGVIVFIREKILLFIKIWASKESMDTTASMHIGGNFIFLILMTALFILAVVRKRNKLKYMRELSDERKLRCCTEIVNRDTLLLKIYLMSFPFLLLFGSDSSVRSTMLLNQVLIVMLPNSLDVFTESSRKVVRMILVLFLIAFFATNTLLPNNFDIVPYKFFWQ